MAEAGDVAGEWDVVCDWVEEGYRNVAPKRLTAEPERTRPARG